MRQQRPCRRAARLPARVSAGETSYIPSYFIERTRMKDCLVLLERPEKPDKKLDKVYVEN